MEAGSDPHRVRRSHPPMTADAAYAACLRLARGHYENFPVASWMVPAPIRRHVAAVYAFARIADDFADEPGRSNDERLAFLADWRARLHAAALLAAAQAPAGTPSHPGTPVLADAVFVALADTMRSFSLPVALFDDLLSAFEQDVVTSRYESWAEIEDYCRRSANPVGRLVLRLFGYDDATLDRQSDAVCTALQLTNFWQDFAVDWGRGRLYVPAEEWRAHGADLTALDRGPLPPEWVDTLRACVGRTRALFGEGRPVCDGVSGRLRYELRATWLGGVCILDRIEQGGFDLRRARPSLGPYDGLVIACRALGWRRAG